MRHTPESASFLAILCLLVSSGLSVSPGLCLSTVSWDGRSVTLATATTPQPAAERECLAHLVSPMILYADVYDSWSQEITRDILSNANRYVINTVRRPSGYLVTLNYHQLIRDLVTLLFGEITPRVAVIAEEEIVRRRVFDPAVETEANRQLVEYGFQTVDMCTSEEAKWREYLLQAIDGDQKMLTWAQTELEADCILWGCGLAVETPAGGAEVRTEVKTIEVATGRVLGAEAETSSRRSATLEIAAKQALQDATRKAMPKLVASMLNAFGKPIHRVRLWDVRSVSDVTAVKRGIEGSIPGSKVKVSSMDVRAGRVAVLEVAVKCSAADLAEAMEELRSPRVQVMSINCRSLVARLF
ncbi:MAG: hypothetical protein H5T86_13195 [Armatimonadetes bacterium]|nr:hypothetical protein [Armatimonadota bacterium]